MTGSLFSPQRVKSYVGAVTATPVMSAVSADFDGGLTPAQVDREGRRQQPARYGPARICATDASPAQAQQIATSTANQFKTYVDSLESTLQTRRVLRFTISQVSAPHSLPPRSRRAQRSILPSGSWSGLAVGVGAAVLLETLDTRIKSLDVLAKHFKQPLLGIIGYEANAAKRPLIVQDTSQSKRSRKSFRQVRTNLQFVDVDHRPRSIVVTSSMPREGKSTTAINLAITIAQTGQPVFLIEGVPTSSDGR